MPWSKCEEIETLQNYMAITLKSQREIELIRKAGAVVAKVLSKLQIMAEPGVTTARLNDLALQMSVEAGAESLFKGVRNPYARNTFPGAICTSLNEQIVHGIPSEAVKLKDGDILSVDFGVKLDGYCADSAVTIGIGKVSEYKCKLMEVTEHVLDIPVLPDRRGEDVVEGDVVAGVLFDDPAHGRDLVGMEHRTEGVAGVEDCSQRSRHSHEFVRYDHGRTVRLSGTDSFQRRDSRGRKPYVLFEFP